MFPQGRRETGGDALGSDDIIGSANRCVVLVLVRLARQHRKDAPMHVNKRVGVAGLIEPRYLTKLKRT
jgi:hypothetical protein